MAGSISDMQAHMKKKEGGVDRLGEDVIRVLITGVIKGIAYLHENFLVHRDLKTSNLLISNEGHA